VIGLDFSLPMLRVARQRAAGRWVVVAGDALALPFADGSLAAAATAFTLRNVVDLPGALAELARVLRPGGRLAVLELSHAAGLWRLPLAVHREVVVPLLGRLLSSDPAAYRYLPASLRPFPPAEALGALIAVAGFRAVRWQTWFGGAVALHTAERAAA
jgi:demethylmenaquinone methyltransferase/2-methoxy-6-polyprenyl-1,4-benzoquinol methylase